MTEQAATPGWIQTASGKAVNIFEFTRDMVDIRDIAHGLSNQCRYAGHTRSFYSVAQHSVMVMDLLYDSGLELKRAALLHDASEAYLSDIPRPLKHSEMFGAYREYEAHIQAEIESCFDIDVTNGILRAIKRADDIMLATEAYQLMQPLAPRIWQFPEPPNMAIQIEPLPPKAAKDAFLLAARTLGIR